jgi:transposase
MPMTLNESQIRELRELHRTLESKKQADKIKAVVMLNDGFTSSEIARALMIDETTVRRHINRYRRHGLTKYLESLYPGKKSSLTEYQEAELKESFRLATPQTAKAVALHVKNMYGVNYSTVGATKLMHRLGFVYKKPKIMPGKVNLFDQAKFIGEYLELKRNLRKNDQIYFADATHPTHNTKAAYGWILKGKKNDKYIKSNTGRSRINLNGAINLANKKAVVLEELTVNSSSTVRLLNEIKRKQKLGRVYVILDNARYHHSREVGRWLLHHPRFKLKFLPPYSPNLNPIERLWKLYHTKITNNQYFESFKDFKKVTLEFFENLKQYRGELDSLLTDNFQTLPALNLQFQV